MSLSKAQLNKLSKEELVNFTFKIQEAHGKHIEDIVKKLDQALESVQAITDRQQIIESSLSVSNNVNDKLQKSPGWPWPQLQLEMSEREVKSIVAGQKT